jgi:protein-tyrosine-phosphatase
VAELKRETVDMQKILVGGIVASFLGCVLGLSCVQAQETATKVKSILIVDRGNIQRSVVAELLLRRLLKERGLEAQYTVFSRGLQGTPASPEVPVHNNLKYYNKTTSPGMEWENSLPTLQELGVADDLQKHKATVLSQKDLEKAALVLAMDSPTLSDPSWGISAQFPAYSKKSILFTELVGSSAGIADGYGAADSNRHRQVILDIDRILRRGLDDLIKRVSD